MMSPAACLLPAVLDSIGNAIHITDIFHRPPLTAILACYGRVVVLMLPFTRTAETVVLTEHFYHAIIDSTGIQKAKGCSVFLCSCKKEGEPQSMEQSPPAPAHCIS